jgi:hypothetical protein
MKYGFFLMIFIQMFSLLIRADQSSKVLPLTESSELPTKDFSSVRSRTTTLIDEDSLAQLVGEDDCGAILNAVAGHDFTKLPPRILAVTAACEPPGKDPEKMFTYAEKLSPHNDSILLLHARYRRKKLSINETPLWEELLHYSQNPKIKTLAAEYLKGREDVKTNPLRLRPASLYVTVAAGGIYESNPRALAASDPNFNKSASSGVTGTAATRVSLDSSVGSVNFDYVASATNYFNTSDVNLLTQDFDVPVVFQSTKELSFAFRPFASYFLLAGQQFYDRIGAAFMHSYEGTQFAQTFQFQIYQDAYFIASFSALGGTHYRAEYKIHLPEDKLFNMQWVAFLDHVNASQDRANNQLIYYSHTDTGISASFSHAFSYVVIGLVPQFYVRDDDQDSQYTNAGGNSSSLRRQDYQYVTRAYVSFPLSDMFGLNAYYEYNSIVSNTGTATYIDRNSSDQLVGLQLRSTFNDLY